jgi:hypothetical protein
MRIGSAARDICGSNHAPAITTAAIRIVGLPSTLIISSLFSLVWPFLSPVLIFYRGAIPAKYPRRPPRRDQIFRRSRAVTRLDLPRQSGRHDLRGSSEIAAGGCW